MRIYLDDKEENVRKKKGLTNSYIIFLQSNYIVIINIFTVIVCIQNIWYWS